MTPTDPTRDTIRARCGQPVLAVASHSFPKNPTLRAELLSRYPDSRFQRDRSPLAGPALVAFLRGHDKAITGLEALDDAVFAALPELKIVSKYGVGLDTIDIEAAARHGVSVRWTPGVNRQSVAELTIAFMIMLARNVSAVSQRSPDRDLDGGRRTSAFVSDRGDSWMRERRPDGCSPVACIWRAGDRARHQKRRRFLSRERRRVRQLRNAASRLGLRHGARAARLDRREG